jgi:hypothetical protein
MASHSIRKASSEYMRDPDYFRKQGVRGARLQAANMTPAQRKARATKASKAAALARTKKKHAKNAKGWPMGQLTLRPIGWSRQGNDPAITGTVWQYAVGGLPGGQQAEVAQFGPGYPWQTRVAQDGRFTNNWSGSYETAAEALRQLAHTFGTHGWDRPHWWLRSTRAALAAYLDEHPNWGRKRSREVLLPDGHWHPVADGSFELDSYEYVRAKEMKPGTSNPGMRLGGG